MPPKPSCTRPAASPACRPPNASSYRNRQGSRRQDWRTRGDRRDRLPPGSSSAVPPDGARSAAPSGSRAQDGRPPLPRTRRSARSRISKRRRERAASRDQRHGREEGNADSESARGAAPFHRPSADAGSVRDGGGTGRGIAGTRARCRHLNGRQRPPRLRYLRRPRHPRCGRPFLPDGRVYRIQAGRTCPRAWRHEVERPAVGRVPGRPAARPSREPRRGAPVFHRLQGA